jgi:hypothetical protein
LLLECKGYLPLLEKIGAKLSNVTTGSSLWEAYDEEFEKRKEDLDIESSLILNIKKEFWKCTFCNFDENITNNDICQYCYLNRYNVENEGDEIYEEVETKEVVEEEEEEEVNSISNLTSNTPEKKKKKKKKSKKKKQKVESVLTEEIENIKSISNEEEEDEEKKFTYNFDKIENLEFKDLKKNENFELKDFKKNENLDFKEFKKNENLDMKKQENLIKITSPSKNVTDIKFNFSDDNNHINKYIDIVDKDIGIDDYTNQNLENFIFNKKLAEKKSSRFFTLNLNKKKTLNFGYDNQSSKSDNIMSNSKDENVNI